jgi:serine/threonine-protein kinase
MEYLAGESLSTRLRRTGVLPPEEAVDIVLQAASALGAAHVKGIVHRDLKPDNLFLVPDPLAPGRCTVKLLDFGIAKLDRGFKSGGVRNTLAGVLMGTPVYMSPEQCLGNVEVDHRSDMYSLGIILYELLCGTPPFVSDGQGELVYFHISAPPPALRRRNPNVPEALEAIVHRMLAKEPADRVQTMVDLQRALTGATPGAAAVEAGPRPRRNSRPITTLAASVVPDLPPPPERRSHWLGRMAFVAALVTAGGLTYWKRDQLHPHADPVAAPAAAIAAPSAGPTVLQLPAPAPASIRVSISSEPAGARLMRERDGQTLGTTPFSDNWPETEGEERLRLELDGFESETIVVPLHRGTDLQLALKPIAIAPRPKARVHVAPASRKLRPTAAPTPVRKPHPMPAGPSTPHEPVPL